MSLDFDKFTREEIIEWIISSISDISEGHFMAGWMAGIEYVIWADIHSDEPKYMDRITAAMLMEASKSINGWVSWEEEPHDAAVFVSKEKWLLKIIENGK